MTAKLAAVATLASHRAVGLVAKGLDIGGEDLATADLSGLRGDMIDLRGTILREANLRGMFLTDCTFDGADLEGAYLTGSTLYSCYFLGARCAGASLARVQIELGSYRDVDLTGADLFSATVSGTSFAGATPLTDAPPSRGSAAGSTTSGAATRASAACWTWRPASSLPSRQRIPAVAAATGWLTPTSRGYLRPTPSAYASCRGACHARSPS